MENSGARTGLSRMKEKTLDWFLASRGRILEHQDWITGLLPCETSPVLGRFSLSRQRLCSFQFTPVVA